MENMKNLGMTHVDRTINGTVHEWLTAYNDWFRLTIKNMNCLCLGNYIYQDCFRLTVHKFQVSTVHVTNYIQELT